MSRMNYVQAVLCCLLSGKKGDGEEVFFNPVFCGATGLNPRYLCSEIDNEWEEEWDTDSMEESLLRLVKNREASSQNSVKQHDVANWCKTNKEHYQTFCKWLRPKMSTRRRRLSEFRQGILTQVDAMSESMYRFMCKHQFQPDLDMQQRRVILFGLNLIGQPAAEYQDSKWALSREMGSAITYLFNHIAYVERRKAKRLEAKKRRLLLQKKSRNKC